MRNNNNNNNNMTNNNMTEELVNKIAAFLGQDNFVDYQYSIDNFELKQADADIKIVMTISVKPTAKVLCGGCGNFTSKGYMVKTSGVECCLDCGMELMREGVQQ